MIVAHPSQKQLYLYGEGQNLEKNPPRVESNIQSSETIIEEEQLEETSWEFFMHLNWFLYYLVEIQYNLYQKVS
jgi:hypothetical protein